MGLGKLRRKGAIRIEGVAKPAAPAKPRQAAAKVAAMATKITASPKGRLTRKAA
jgi:hypothetical protein